MDYGTRGLPQIHRSNPKTRPPTTSERSRGRRCNNKPQRREGGTGCGSITGSYTREKRNACHLLPADAIFSDGKLSLLATAADSSALSTNRRNGCCRRGNDETCSTANPTTASPYVLLSCSSPAKMISNVASILELIFGNSRSSFVVEEVVRKRLRSDESG
ncbi:unnamed protein product [Linum trigynum]|uniref:Uncharacterized protein n=1 Tax=Linum trigynum TaxID=586398 RepID=A0AAV2DCQ2_9ROSI